MKVNKKGFTLVELLVVLLIIGILAAIATPLYLQNAQRARASEAVATMSQIRQSLREYFLNNNTYLAVNSTWGTADGAIQNATTEATPGLNVDTGVAQYFSNGAFRVRTTGIAADAPFASLSPNAVNFIIDAEGSRSQACAGAADDNCAVKNTQVNTMALKMDNSGRIFVTYDSAATPVVWEAY